MSCRMFGTVLVAATVALSGVACSDKTADRAPELATKTPEQPVNQPKTVTGCLQASAAPNTFVLTAAESAGATTTATYQLVPKEGVDLHAYAGQNVELSGTLRSQQTVATAGKVEEAPAKGVAGTPTVETRSELEVRRFDVESVKPTGTRCAEK